MSRPFSSFRNFAFVLIALALLVRAAIPSGWMPAGDKAFALQVCAGMEMQTVWLDRDGTLHKTDPSKNDHKDDSKQDCAFAGFASHAILGDYHHFALTDLRASDSIASKPSIAAIGRGLAAPPPPSTGPPILI